MRADDFFSVSADNAVFHGSSVKKASGQGKQDVARVG